MSRSTRIFGSSQAGCPMAKKTDRRMPIGLGMLIAVLGMLFGPLPLAASAAGAPHAATPVMGSYVSVTPFRITDTRSNSGQPNAGKTLTAAATLSVQVTGLGTVPAGASAAVLNVTAVNPTASGFLTVFPAGTTMPTVSNLNFTPGVTVANLVTVPLSSSARSRYSTTPVAPTSWSTSTATTRAPLRQAVAACTTPCRRPVCSAASSSARRSARTQARRLSSRAQGHLTECLPARPR